jgi:sodium/potassium-transporting ATPase subunit alpha
MIIICAVTDILPALSLAYEQAEAGLLDRPPRNVRTDRLVDWKLLFHAYFVLGLMECLSAMALSFSYLQRKGVYFSDIVLAYGGYKGDLNPEVVQEHIYVAQSIYFFTLVVSLEWQGDDKMMIDTLHYPDHAMG